MRRPKLLICREDGICRWQIEGFGMRPSAVRIGQVLAHPHEGIKGDGFIYGENKSVPFSGYSLHAFEKKAQKTRQADIELAQARYKEGEMVFE